MFARKEKESIEDYNKRLEDEVNSPEPKEEKKEGLNKTNLAGNVLSGFGMTFQVIAGIGAGVMACASIASMLGIGMLYSILIMAGVGVVLSLIGNKLMTESYLNHLHGA